MIRLLSLFSGIGAFESALRRGGYQFETVNYCEIDPYAAKAYSQIHGISEDYNLHDVRQVNTLLMDNVNLMTWGWPCQDISCAGKQRGFTDSDGNRTRSGLFFEGLRILETLQPEYAIAENVKALTGKKFTAEFETVLTSLDKAGYNNYWQVLNAKDYGVPQNRERVFIVSIRKDIDTGAFTFPEKQELKLRVKDLLEPVVDEKYYIDNERSRNLIRQITAKFDLGGGIAVVDSTINDPNVKDISNCIKARYDAGIENQRSVGTAVIEPKIKRLGNLYDENAGGARAGNVYAPNGLAPALQTAQGGNRQPLIIEPHANKIVRAGTIGKHETDEVLSVCGISKTLKATDYKNPVKIMASEPKIKIVGRMDGYERTGRVYSSNGIACNLLAWGNSMQILEEPAPKGGQREVKILETTQEAYRIRKLTPRECFRLMGFTDADFDKIKGISNTQLYKMAGNSIVVNVLEAILKQLFKETNKE